MQGIGGVASRGVGTGNWRLCKEMSVNHRRSALVAVVLALGLLGGCATTDLSEVDVRDPEMVRLDDALSRLPHLAQGLQYHCAKLRLNRAGSEKAGSFLRISEDAEVLKELAAVVPETTRFPGVPGTRVKEMSAKLQGLADQLLKAARQRNAKAATQAAAETARIAGNLAAYVSQMRPILMRRR